jgi:hypothetical protein
MRIDRRPSDGILVLRDPQGGGGILQRSFGLILTLGGGFAFQHLVRTGGWATCNDLCGVGFAAFVYVGGLVALAHLDDVRLDLVRRTYLRRFGLWPFHSCRQGSFNEIGSIRMRLETRTLPPRVGTVGVIAVIIASLEWKDPAVPALSFQRADGKPAGSHVTTLAQADNARSAVLAEANKLSRLIGIPVVDSRSRS